MVAVYTRQVSAASDTVVSREIHRKSKCIPTVVPKLAVAPQAASEVVQPRPRDSGCMDFLPPVGECLESLGMDTPGAVVSGMEVAGGSPPADIDISGGPDVLQPAISVMTVVSEKWMERFVINLDVLCSDGFASGDVLQTAVSVTTVVSEKWMEIDTPDAVVSGTKVADKVLWPILTLAGVRMCYSQRYM